MDKPFYEKSLESFKEATKHPPDFLLATAKLSDKLQQNLKELYDFSKTQAEPTEFKFTSLPKLIVKNFDSEQIWQQIELQNSNILTTCVPKISRFLAQKSNLVFDNSILIKNNEGEEASGSSEDENVTVGSDFEEEIQEEDEDMASGDEQPNNVPKVSKKKSIVDDDFFKLSEMEEFLKGEEKKLESDGKRKKDVSDDDDDEDNDDSDNESIDFFENQESEEDDKEENEAKMARFKDYFVQKDKPVKKAKNKSLLSDDEDDDDIEDENEIGQTKSSLEHRQERLSRKIGELEEEAVSDKPWQLKGEVTGESRPQNSLLEEVLEFDMTSRPAPVITEQTSLQLEDIIRQRIKDKAFDSVERKIKPVETPLEYKKKLVLDQEKSKESLAQIYEKEYLEQQASLDPDRTDKDKEPETHVEIRKMMTSLFNKLDALSNFHFTSKPAIPDLKIISNLPAVNMEEVAPVAASDAALLAPEEVKRKTKGDVIGKSERTKADKNRERKKKKLKQKIHAKEKLKKEALKGKQLSGGVPVKYAAKKQKLKKG